MTDNHPDPQRDRTGDPEDPDHRHAPLAAAVAAIPPADELTRARHLQTALSAFAESPAATNLAARARRRLWISRTLGGAAAVTLVILGAGVLLPMMNLSGGQDAGTEALSDAPTQAEPEAAATADASEVESGSAPEAAPPAMLAAPGTLRAAEATPCAADLETLVPELATIDSWTADQTMVEGRTLLRIEAFARSSEDPVLVVDIDADRCEVIRIQRSDP